MRNNLALTLSILRIHLKKYLTFFRKNCETAIKITCWMLNENDSDLAIAYKDC